jgi:hypothetical protein
MIFRRCFISGISYGNENGDALKGVVGWWKSSYVFLSRNYCIRTIFLTGLQVTVPD